MSTEENIVEICSAYAEQSAKNAGNALQSATNAASSAENAGASALQAKQAKEVIEGLAGGLQAAAETATQKAEEASKSATASAKSEQEAQRIADNLGKVGTLPERVEAVEKEMLGTLPQALVGYEYNVKSWVGKEETNSIILGKVCPAPVGFILINGTLSPYAGREVVWLKPNGEKIQLVSQKDVESHPWLVYSGLTIRALWKDGETSCFVAVRNSVTYKVNIPFVNGEPQEVITTIVDGADITCDSAYAIKIGEGFILANNGQIFNSNTLKQTGNVSLTTRRIITPSDTSIVGAYATTSNGVVLISADENGAPIVTTKSANKNFLPLANGKFVVGTFGANLDWGTMFTCEGSASESNNKGITGNYVPAVINADIGDYIINPFALYLPCSWGTSTSSVDYSVPIVRFRKPALSWTLSGHTLCALKSGDAIFLRVLFADILITKEELV